MNKLFLDQKIDFEQYDKRMRESTAIIHNQEKQRKAVRRKIKLAAASTSYSRTLLEADRKQIRDNEQLSEMIAAFCLINCVEFDELVKKCRLRHFVVKRQVLSWVIRKYKEISTNRIGEMLGNRDHATIIYSLRTVAGAIDTKDPLTMDVLNKTLSEFKRIGIIQSVEYYLDTNWRIA